jgi:hypothetical protein
MQILDHRHRPLRPRRESPPRRAPARRSNARPGRAASVKITESILPKTMFDPPSLEGVGEGRGWNRAPAVYLRSSDRTGDASA